jgi:sodium transport system ATP-binding protein
LRAEHSQVPPSSAPSGKAAPVVVRELTKTFLDESRGTIHAVNGINFECREGEVFGLLGANGAGKTTTLRMLSTIISPTAGTAQILGHDIVGNPAGVRRSLGFYSASTALYPRLTARETIEFFAKINQYPEGKIKERVEALLNRFGISHYADVRVEKMSTGMKQKVSIARTVAHNPLIIIFDEPTVGLDVLNAIEVQDAILELRNEGRTVIFSTHIMSEAEKLCDRIAIIHNGRILACDTLEGLRATTGQHYLEDIFVRFVKGPA